MNTKRIALFAALAAGSLALASCSGGGDKEEQPEANSTVETVTEPVNMTPLPTEAPAAPQIDNAEAEAQPPVPPHVITPDQQTQEDADATGMTARVSRDETANDTQPAEQ
ncbi:hypothetical protein AB2M62_04900 [Sphingomonas sp. MMS12-HWE2-04]|uniref:hypothetical protein n=1 Tax=Sphingomonas sp. MMS12-HWE2-04 TaxID=3234199 RepID=UPI0038506769